MSHWECAGKSDDWYTPRYVFDALGCRFDMDVAANPSFAVYCTPADTCLFTHSLELPWKGFVYMNPPFGGRNSLDPWLEKFFTHGNGIALTPDRTSAPWFRKHWIKADLVMFTEKIRFLRPDGSEGASPSCGTALWAAGDKAVSALRAAAKRGLGILSKPEEAQA